MSGPAVRIVDVTDDAGFALLPPCADPGADHRTCDHWEDAERGSRAARAAWLPGAPRPAATAAPSRPRNPFLDDGDAPLANPFAPPPPSRPVVAPDAPPKLRLLVRGLAVFGSYAKVLLEDDAPAAFAQFGPLSAYPRALRTRALYPALPDAPLPAVITCVATAAGMRGRGHATRLVTAVCADLAGRGFAAVEVYPEIGADPDRTSAPAPGFWARLGFVVAAADDRYPVLRRELA